MQLTVKQLKNREPGSGMAVIDRDALQELGVSSGDFVAIDGREGGRTVARVWPSDTSDAGRGIVRIDGQLRRAANVGIDDRVTVEPTTVEPADRITVALPQSLRIRGDLGSQLRDQLIDQAVTAGQTVAFAIGFGMFSGRSGRRIPLTIVETRPGRRHRRRPRRCPVAVPTVHTASAAVTERHGRWTSRGSNRRRIRIRPAAHHVSPS